MDTVESFHLKDTELKLRTNQVYSADESVLPKKILVHKHK